MQEYRAAGNRCAFDFSRPLPISSQDARNSLLRRKFEIRKVDLFSLALQQLGKPYQRGVHPRLWPTRFDCSALTKWLYAQCGISIPRQSIAQRGAGQEISLNDLRLGDLIFSSGPKNYFTPSCGDEIGHVGFIIDPETVVHAASSSSGVIKSSLDSFLQPKRFRGARRMVSDLESLETVIVPDERFIETSSNLYWTIFRIAHIASVATDQAGA